MANLAPEIYQNPTEHKIAIDLTNQGIFLPVITVLMKIFYYYKNINSQLII